MLVKFIENIDKKRVRIVMEDDNFLPLYRGELATYGIEESTDIEDDVLETLLKHIEKRAKERAMYILKNSDKTEKQLRDRLAGGYYPPAIIDNTINYLKKYGYIDDYNFCENFVKIYGESISRKMLTLKLYQKGIDKKISDMVLDEYYKKNDNQREQIINILEKKQSDYENMDRKEKNKLISCLLRKGFEYDDVLEVIRNFDKNAQYKY